MVDREHGIIFEIGNRLTFVLVIHVIPYDDIPYRTNISYLIVNLLVLLRVTKLRVTL